MAMVRSNSTVSAKVSSSTSRSPQGAAQQVPEAARSRSCSRPPPPARRPAPPAARSASGAPATQHEQQQEHARAACRRPASARRRGHWWRCARWRRWRAGRRTAPRRRWRRPARPVRSWSGGGRPVMPSATTAESSDSTPARKAMVKRARAATPQVRSNGMSRQRGHGSDAGMRAEARCRSCRTGRCSTSGRRRAGDHRDQEARPRGSQRRSATISASARSARPALAGLTVSSAPP